MMETPEECRLLRLQKQMAGYKLLIIDELGFVPLSNTGAELMFELVSQRYERGSPAICPLRNGAKPSGPSVSQVRSLTA